MDVVEKLEILALAHISSECNTTTLALNAARAALEHCGCPRTSVAIPVQKFEMHEIQEKIDLQDYRAPDMGGLKQPLDE